MATSTKREQLRQAAAKIAMGQSSNASINIDSKLDNAMKEHNKNRRLTNEQLKRRATV